MAVLREAKNHPGLMRLLARSATNLKPPLGFRGALVTESTGDANGIDLKKVPDLDFKKIETQKDRIDF